MVIIVLVVYQSFTQQNPSAQKCKNGLDWNNDGTSNMEDDDDFYVDAVAGANSQVLHGDERRGCHKLLWVCPKRLEKCGCLS